MLVAHCGDSTHGPRNKIERRGQPKILCTILVSQAVQKRRGDLAPRLSSGNRQIILSMPLTLNSRGSVVPDHTHRGLFLSKSQCASNIRSKCTWYL